MSCNVSLNAVELAKMLPPSPVDSARLPRGTSPVPDHHVDRIPMLETLVHELTSVEGASALHVLAGIRVGWKSVFAFAVVRSLEVYLPPGGGKKS